MANNVIGRVVATEKCPTTIDDFTFWTDPDLILNPFDIVKVEHVNKSYSYGVIEDIAGMKNKLCKCISHKNFDYTKNCSQIGQR